MKNKKYMIISTDVAETPEKIQHPQGSIRIFNTYLKLNNKMTNNPILK